MLPELTDRENEFRKLIADGLTNKEISCCLLISESTVENHIHNIHEKLGISNRAQAVAHLFCLRTISQNERYQPRGKPRTLSSAACGGVLDPKRNKGNPP